jgi:hypothetical protein
MSAKKPQSAAADPDIDLARTIGRLATGFVAGSRGSEDCEMAAHSGDTKEFRELEFKQQANAISAMIINLEAMISNNARNSPHGAAVTGAKRVRQVERLLTRLRRDLPAPVGAREAWARPAADTGHGPRAALRHRSVVRGRARSAWSIFGFRSTNGPYCTRRK